MKYILFLFFVFSHASALTITENFVDFENFPLEVFTDKENIYTIDTIADAPFEKSKSKESFGYKKNQTFWIRTHIINHSPKDQVLYLYHKDGYTYLDVIFYELQQGVLLKEKKLDRNIPLGDKLVKDASPVYIMELKQGEEKTVYIRNISKSTMLVNLQVLDIDHYHHANLVKNVLLFFFFGIVVSLAFYNMMLFISIRSIEYIYYVFFLGGSIIYLLYVSGLPLEFFGMDGRIYAFFLYGIFVLLIALMLFSQKVLETKKTLPKVHSYLNVLMYANVLLFTVAFTIGISNILSFLSLSALTVASSLLVIGFLSLKKGVKTSVYFIYSIGFYLIFALIGIFTYFGIFPYTDFTRYALFSASLSEVFLLSLLLSYRISLLRARAAQSEKELREEVVQRNAILKEQVDERTSELQILNSDLEGRVTKSIDEIRKKDEELLRQSRMAMMGEMLSMIAHQWRQPLSSIASVRNNMQLDLELGVMDKKSIAEQLASLSDYIQFMSKTIDDFRNFFKPERSKNFVSLADVIVDAVGIITPTLRSNHIAIELSMDSTKKIYTFKNELIQVLLNIINNAQDIFIEKGMEEPKLLIELKETDEIQSITITDNAGGIPPSVIEKIFDPYFSTKDDKNGTGLGLYMSKIIVEDHCFGTINAVNTAHGAQFTLSFALVDVGEP